MDFQPTAAIIGAGLGGLCVGLKLKQAGLQKFNIFEKAGRVGGTWHYNTYPGCSCDVPAQLYSYSFEPNPGWARVYANADEIQSYCEKVTDKYQLRQHLKLGAELRSAAWETDRNKWRLHFASGAIAEADVLISCVGQLHQPVFPNIEGRTTFAGESFHSARWRHDLSLTGKRIGVIGSAASAVQLIPTVVAEASHVSVFQRSANYVLPRPDRVTSKFERGLLKRVPWLMKIARNRIYWWAEWMLGGVIDAQDWRARFFTETALDHLAEQVRDPELRAKLTPDYPIGCKRVLFSNDYYPALTKRHVALVTDPIARIVPEGLLTRDGRLHELDIIIYATGFEASGFKWSENIFGKAGTPLSEAWKDGAEAYHGVVVAGFPNFYMTYGPNTNLGHNSMIYMIEQQADYIVQCVQAMETENLGHVEIRRIAQIDFNKSLREALEKTPWAGDCGSWYKNASGRITCNWTGDTQLYRKIMRRPHFDDFELHPRLPIDRTQPQEAMLSMEETEPVGLLKWLD